MAWLAGFTAEKAVATSPVTLVTIFVVMYNRIVCIPTRKNHVNQNEVSLHVNAV